MVIGIERGCHRLWRQNKRTYRRLSKYLRIRKGIGSLAISINGEIIERRPERGRSQFDSGPGKQKLPGKRMKEEKLRPSHEQDIRGAVTGRDVELREVISPARATCQNAFMACELRRT